jgi:hypothetical protein
MTLLKIIISSLYGLTGIVAIIAYLPIIKDLTQKKNTANKLSYSLWSICNLIVVLYGILVLKDLLMITISGLNLFFCSLILFLSLIIKQKN